MLMTRFLTMGLLTFPSGREAHYEVLLADFFPFPSLYLSLLVGIYLGRRELVDSIPNVFFLWLS